MAARRPRDPAGPSARTDRGRGWTRSLRFRLLVAVNAAVGSGLAFLLLVDYRQELTERKTTLHVALEEEAKTLLPAIRRLSTGGEPAVRAHIDEVCGSMRESSSPGHHIAVESGDRFLQARAHHRESPEIVAAMRRAARSPSRMAGFGDDAIIVGTASDGVRTVYVSERASHIMGAVRRRTLRRVGALAFLGAVATVVVNLILLRLVIRPLGKLVATVRRIGAGELGAQAGGLRSRELDYVAFELNEASTALARADAERAAGMAKAKRIQAHLCRGARDAPGLRFAHYYRPAADVAGDYYDVLRLSDGSSLICLADVTGHGVPAALGMATLKTLLVAASRSIVEPNRILAFANERFRDVTLAEDFASAVVARWDPRAETIEYAGAGHEPGLLLQASGDTVTRLRSTGMVLGVMEDASYDVEVVAVRDGARLLLVTDGVTETASPERELFGLERVEEAFAACRGEPPNRTIDRIAGAVIRHRGAAPQRDDVTMVLAEFGGFPKA